MQYFKIYIKLQQVNPNFVCIFVFRIGPINCSFLFIFHFKFHGTRFIKIFQKSGIPILAYCYHVLQLSTIKLQQLDTNFFHV